MDHSIRVRQWTHLSVLVAVESSDEKNVFNFKRMKNKEIVVYNCTNTNDQQKMRKYIAGKIKGNLYKKYKFHHLY